MTDIGELIVRIKADATELEQEMRKANGIVKQNAGGMSDAFKDLKSQILSLAPALSVVAFVQFGRNAFDAADHINDLAQRTGFLGSTLSALNVPLKQGGSNLDEFSASINRMNAMIGEAAKGTNEEAVKAFDGLGLSVKKLKALSPEQQFYEIATALNGVKSQSELTEKGMNIFGRSFATLIPLIKESKGNVAEFVEEAKRLDNALTDDELKRIDDLGDRWTASLEAMKLKLLEVVPLIEKLAALPDYLRAAFIEIPQKAGEGIGNYLKNGTVNPRVSTTRPESVSEATFLAKGFGDLADKPTSAKGGNADLLDLKAKAEAAKKLADARKTLDEYNLSLQRQNNILHESPREQAAMEAGYKTIDLAQKAGIKDASDLIEANMNLARTNYDLAQSMQEAARFQQELHDKLSSTLTDIVFKAGSAKEAMLGFAESIAKAAFEKRVAGPLADSLIGTGGSSGLLDNAIGGIGSLLGFAAGGSPPVGVPSIVGERGPEIFVPNAAGTIIPNGVMGGHTVIVNQSFVLNPGATEQTVAQLRNLAPAIAAQAQAAVFAEMQRGGAASRITGLRS